MLKAAMVVQEYIQVTGDLPFGVSLLISGWNDDKQSLVQCDPSVVYYGWKTISIGMNYVNEKTFLEIR
ncbi:proteasome subunit alpha type-2-like [Rhodnius prolixus]|uniref:proteasome subunit alpha type-2-like n=1 Tax=Rhodnius prolixus TaxID=13249 RepID=UPI003D188CD9